MPNLPPLYLHNGAALMRADGLLFGECRCPACCPSFRFFVGVGAYYYSATFSNVRATVALIQWEKRGAAYERVSESVDITGLGSDAKGVDLLSFRKNDPCGIKPAPCSAEVRATNQSWAGSSAGSSGTILGVHQGGRHVTVRIGVRVDADNSSGTDAASISIPAAVNSASTNSCAKYHITEGSTIVNSRTEPTTIVHKHSAVLSPSQTRSDLLSDPQTITIGAHTTGSFGAWWEWDLYLDAQYDQGLIDT